MEIARNENREKMEIGKKEIGKIGHQEKCSLRKIEIGEIVKIQNEKKDRFARVKTWEEKKLVKKGYWEKMK